MQISVTPAEKLSPEQLRAWDMLQRGDANCDNPFFRPELIQLAARVQPNIEVAVMHQGGEPVGFLPFERAAGDIGHPVIARISDMHGAVVRRDIQWDAAGLIREAGLNVWHFDHLPATQEAFAPWFQFLDDSPYMDLSEGFSGWCQHRREAGSSAISQAKRKTRKLGKDIGPVRFELHSGEPEVLAALTSWKSAQLDQQGYLNVFHFDWVRNLLELLRDWSTEGCRTCMSALYAGDRLVAAHLGLQSGAVLSSWIPAYDADVSRYSPGLILHVEMARAAAEAGITRIDLCRGENQLKNSLMSDSFPVAVGSLDLRPFRRLMTAGYYRARQIARESSFGQVPLSVYRAIRNRLVRS